MTIRTPGATAILLAAGNGTRMGTKTPKQFLELDGKEVWRYAYDVCVESGLFDEVIVATPEHLGGETRLDTVRNALAQVKTEFVVIHDAARPFIDRRVLVDLLDALAQGWSAAGAALYLTDTIVGHGEYGRMTSVLVRGNYRQSQTPQAFVTELLECGLACNHETTELLELVHMQGHDVKLIPGSPWYFKLTHKPDYYAAEGWLLEQEHRVAVITGASRGIGAEVARYLEDASYTVVNHSRSTGVDVKDYDTVRRAFEETLDKYGKIDCLVNCAGVGRAFPLHEIDHSATCDMVATNIMGTLYCTQFALRHLSPGGVIVTVGSSGIDTGRANQGVYGATKAAAVHLAQVAAIEGQERGISVFVVCPRRTDTQLRRDLMGDVGGDCLDPHDVGTFIGNLCVENPRYLSGQTFFFPAMRS